MRNIPMGFLISLFLLPFSTLHTDTAWAQKQHENMQIQEDRVPEEARDPHGYADGITLTEGPYAQPGPRQLKLADEHAFWAVLGDRLEYSESNNSILYDFQGWYGTTFDRLYVKAEGDIVDDHLEGSRTEVFWSHAMNAFFDTQIGVRFDQYDEGKNRRWLALGVLGLAPYWFELDVTAYLGENGRTAIRLEAEYELLLSQRLILQPRTEFNLNGKEDSANSLGNGLSDFELGVRLRYEFSRQFAPYIGVEWSTAFGETADYLRADGEDDSDTRFVAGLRFWF